MLLFVYLKIINLLLLEPIYKMIKNFEKSYKKSFLYSFFFENEISEIKKFGDINAKNKFFWNNVINNFVEISVIVIIFN